MKKNIPAPFLNRLLPCAIDAIHIKWRFRLVRSLEEAVLDPDLMRLGIPRCGYHTGLQAVISAVVNFSGMRIPPSASNGLTNSGTY